MRRSIYRGTNDEQAEIEARRPPVAPDDIVLELGSGCGLLSTFIAKQLSNSCNLVTVEANPAFSGRSSLSPTENGVKFTVINASGG